MKRGLKRGILFLLIFFVGNFLNSNWDSKSKLREEGQKQAVEAVVKPKPIEQVPAEGGETGAETKEKFKDITFQATSNTSIDKLSLKFQLQQQGLDRSNVGVNFDEENTYSDLEGVTCFRGNNMRDSASYGRIDVTEQKLEKVWEMNIGAIDSWSGVGWNGQPAIVKWKAETVKEMNIYENKKSKGELTEVIYAALDGYVRFIDLEDGKPTREKLNIGAPVKGSLTVDPRGYPILYVGQGIDTNRGNYVPFAYRIFSLIDFKKLYEIKGNDSFALRNWGAFDSTALIDKKSDFFFLCGENGVFYSGKLNTTYSGGQVSMNPVIEKYRYTASESGRRGIENSIAIYKNYGFFADNDGVYQCLDLKTLKPVWTRSVTDDTDSTTVLERDAEGLDLYTACEVDHQGQNGYCYIRKLNASNGELYWENKYKSALDDTNGGALATPIVGKEDIKDLVIFNVARNPQHNSGILVALNKETGKEVWKVSLNNYCWSSPIALYDKDGKSYIIQSDSTGKTFLIEGISGKIMDTINLGSNIEGSPAAFNNMVVVGTRGQKIIGFKVK